MACKYVDACGVDSEIPDVQKELGTEYGTPIISKLYDLQAIRLRMLECRRLLRAHWDRRHCLGRVSGVLLTQDAFDFQ